jgi:ABC-type transport system involved in cytochrome c biogenesis permease component
VVGLHGSDIAHGYLVSHLLTRLTVVMIASPMMGAGAFSREREGGTFESLFLSRLANREIIMAKVLAPLVAHCAYGLPLVPLLLCACAALLTLQLCRYAAFH